MCVQRENDGFQNDAGMELPRLDCNYPRDRTIM